MLNAILKALFVFVLVLSWIGTASVAMAQITIALPAPVKTGGLPLFDALSKRSSNRSFLPDALTDVQLSQILWSAFGVNRNDGKRVIPTSLGKNELQIYAVLASGVYIYDAEKNVLTRVLDEDFTKQYSKAPLTLLYAGSATNPAGALHAGSAYQNVGLYCAAENLANVVRTNVKDILKGKLPTPDSYEVIVTQSIGKPGK
jgi:hypothetical protein